MRRIAGLTVQLFESQAARPPRTQRLDGGAEGDQSLGEVAGIGSDATLGDSQHRVLAVDAFQRRAARTRLPLVAGAPVGVAEIRAAGPLQHIAGQRAHVADLGAGGQRQAVGDHRIVAPHRRVVGDLGHPGEGSQPQALRPRLDAAELALKAVDVDQRLRPGDPQSHVVDDVGAAGEELRRRAGGRFARGPGGETNGGGGVGGALVGERLHQVRLIRGRACSMALTMCG